MNFEQLSDEAIAIGTLGNEALMEGDAQTAEIHFQKAANLMRQAGNEPGEASVLMGLASAAALDDRVADQSRRLVRALDLVQSCPQKGESAEIDELEAQVWYHLGWMVTSCGDVEAGAKLMMFTHLLDESVQQGPTPDWAQDAYALDMGRTFLKEILSSIPA